MTAVLGTGPAHGTLSLNANGSFTYTSAASYSGPDSFTYRASDGSLSSSVATVSITVNRLVFGLNPVQNVPPPPNKTFNIGSAVPLRWQFTVNGAVFNSVNAMPRITILNPSGAIIYDNDPQDPGSSSFQPPTAANGYTWQFNWQTKGLAAGTYRVYIGSEQTGQLYPTNPVGGPFNVTLK
jgi:Big-like domain-containing protein